MSVTIRIPATLRNLTGGRTQIDVEGATVRDILRAADVTHAGLLDRVADGDGNLRRYMSIYVGENDIRFMNGIDTQVADGETVSLISAVAGG